MKSILLPHTYKKIGWSLFLPSLLLGLFFLILPNTQFNSRIVTYGFFGNEMLSHSKPSFRFDEIELIPNLISILFLVGGLLVMFSKEKKEDEYINQIRLNSLQYSVFSNYILLFISFLFIHGFPFFQIMVYNLFTIIVIYILRFQFLIYQNSTNTYE